MGQHLELEITFPDCWDGKYLDVPDHRSHMAYALDGSCPESHPVSVTQLRLFVKYGGAQGGDVVLAPLFNPSSPHADSLTPGIRADLPDSSGTASTQGYTAAGRLLIRLQRIRVVAVKGTPQGVDVGRVRPRCVTDACLGTSWVPVGQFLPSRMEVS